MYMPNTPSYIPLSYSAPLHCIACCVGFTAGMPILDFKEVHPTAVKIFTVFLGSEVMTAQAACLSKSSSEAACHEEREHNIMHSHMYGGLSV